MWKATLEGPMCESELVAVCPSSMRLACGGVPPMQGPETFVDTLEAAERTSHAEWALTPFTKRCAEPIVGDVFVSTRHKGKGSSVVRLEQTVPWRDGKSML